MQCLRIHTLLLLLLTTFMLYGQALGERTEPLIIDHTCTNLSQIPDQWIERAKQDLHVAYEHTSHGSQLPSGMAAIASVLGAQYGYANTSDDPTRLDFHDNAMPDGIDLSSGEYRWYDATREHLNNSANADVNVIMWSWCNIAGHDIDYYLGRMEALIEEYGQGSESHPVPVTFVFMTGHANGGGENDSSDSRNRQIRQHCIQNNRVLFDFSDMENYSPDGLYYLDKRVDDALYYYEGSERRNWASEYLAANPGSELEQLTTACGGCAHSPEGGETPDARLNCVLKGRAVWHLMARLAGWGDCVAAPSDLQARADPANLSVTLSWTGNASAPGEDGFIIQRQAGDDAWDDDHARVAGGVVDFEDTGLTAGTYRYRVVAHLNDGGNGEPCDSGPSSTVTAVTAPPDSDDDGTPDDQDGCPGDASKIEAGVCGCGIPDIDTDNDETLDCEDECPEDPDKTAAGECGCGNPETPGCNRIPMQPVPAYPEDAAVDVMLTPELRTEAFQDPDARDHHLSSHWQISTARDFSTLEYDHESETDLTACTPADPLEGGTVYYWRVRFYDDRGGESLWSQTHTFTSNTPDDVTPQATPDRTDIITGSSDNINCFIQALGCGIRPVPNRD